MDAKATVKVGPFARGGKSRVLTKAADHAFTPQAIVTPVGKASFAHISTLVINLDNGPENHSRRTQFMQRLLDFVQHSRLTVRLAYYPPYHSTYNAIERCWGILEQHWNGALLDSVDAVIQYARSMTWKGNHPVVELVITTYQTGVKLTKAAMKVVESQLERVPQLEKWFVDIRYVSPASRDC